VDATAVGQRVAGPNATVSLAYRGHGNMPELVRRSTYRVTFEHGRGCEAMGKARNDRDVRSIFLGSIRANIPTARGSLSSGPPTTPSSLLLRRIGAPASPTAGPSRTRRAAGTSAISGWPFESHGGDLLLQPCPIWPPASLEVFVSVAKSPMAAYLARPGHYPCRYGGECHGQDAHCHSCVAADTAPTDACGRQAACYRRESQCSREGHGCD
jgi:hypothetical protein